MYVYTKLELSEIVLNLGLFMSVGGLFMLVVQIFFSKQFKQADLSSMIIYID